MEETINKPVETAETKPQESTRLMELEAQLQEKKAHLQEVDERLARKEIEEGIYAYRNSLKEEIKILEREIELCKPAADRRMADLDWVATTIAGNGTVNIRPLKGQPSASRQRRSQRKVPWKGDDHHTLLQ